jgi:hypothetical protein
VDKVVFMGMGEPAHNLDAVLEAIDLLGTAGGIGHKNLVFSTVGDARVFERLPQGRVKPALALSLHSTLAESRARLLPRAPHIAPDELVEQSEAYARATGYPLQVQWTLLDGINDGDDEIDGMVRAARRPARGAEPDPLQPRRGPGLRPARLGTRRGDGAHAAPTRRAHQAAPLGRPGRAGRLRATARARCRAGRASDQAARGRGRRMMLPPPVQDVSAWYGPALTAQGGWLEQLDAGEVAEIEAASRALVESGADLAQLQANDFPLPTLAPRLDALLHELLEGRGFVLLRGLPVQRWPRALSAVAFLGLGSHLGRMRPQNAAGHLLGHVRDVGLSASDPNVRIYQTHERQTFHTDSCDIVGLLCLQTARSGGLSALVSSTTMYNEMRRRRPELAAHAVRAAWPPTAAARCRPAPGRTSRSRCSTGSTASCRRSTSASTSIRRSALPRRRG